MKEDMLSTVIRDLKEAIKNKKKDLIMYQLFIIRQFMEVYSCFSVKYVTFYVSVDKENTELYNKVKEFIESFIENMNKYQLSKDTTIYYDNSFSKIIVEEHIENSVSYYMIKL